MDGTSLTVAEALRDRFPWYCAADLEPFALRSGLPLVSVAGAHASG